MGRTTDIVIVGAGVAGLALALRLGRRGREVLLLEKAATPRDKVCGEGVLPLGLGALERLGFSRGALPGRELKGMAYRTARRAGRLRFPPGTVGRGIRRTDLLSALEGALQDYPSVRLVREEVLEPLWEGPRVVGVQGRGEAYRAETVVAADGVNGRLARRAGIPVTQRGYRMGLRRHYRVSPGRAGNWVRVGLFHPYDVFLTPVGPELLLATTMTTRTGYRHIVRDYDGFLRGLPFAKIFRDAEPAGKQLGWYHPLIRAAHHQREGLLVVGDAGGGLDPCLGLGISLALTTAELAATALGAAGQGGQAPPPWPTPAWPGEPVGKGYDAACRRLFEHYRLFDTIFRLATGSPWGAELLVAAMRIWPATAAKICGVATEGRPWREVFMRGVRRPVAPAMPLPGGKGRKQGLGYPLLHQGKESE